MKKAWNPTRRNRNIGTAKQGYGQDNKMCIPQPWDTDLTFYERLTKYEKYSIKAYGKKITVVVEELTKGFYYSCTGHDVERILNFLPDQDIKGLGLIVFRQPKKKERILSSVWGRLIYCMKFEKKYSPAIIIEAFPECDVYEFSKKQSVDSKQEFELLKKDGLKFREDKRNFVADIDESLVRNVQLYRTLLHEVGHYVQYLEVVERPEEDFEEGASLWEKYLTIPSAEKETFANNYAVKMKAELIQKSVIPFNKIE